MILIPPPPADMLPGWSAEVLAAVGWLLVGWMWWSKRRK